jgi:hypothetical protein
MLSPIRILTIVVVTVLATASHANPTAHRFDRLAKGHYVAGRYQASADAFLRAWQAMPKPKYLFNRAKALENAGDLPMAYLCYLGYLNAALDASDRGEVRAQLSRLARMRPEGSVLLHVVSAQPVIGLVASAAPGIRIGATPTVLLLPAGEIVIEGRGPRGHVELAASLPAGSDEVFRLPTGAGAAPGAAPAQKL